ncbi:hypothetical protein EDD85DRAFT_281990 [Armillaria nabsnona]|nr:hypothetical protein EDD85DRAFT_281990 [Armillaria nabsnona]
MNFEENIYIFCDGCTKELHKPYLDALPSVLRSLRSAKQVSPSAEMVKIHTKLKSEIIRLEKLIKALQYNLGRLKRVAPTYASLFSPVRRLPFEVLQEIFEQTLYSSVDDMFPSSDTNKAVSLTPIRLASVCSYWRGVCLASPSLWQHMYISIGVQDIHSRELDLIRAFQQRAQSKDVLSLRICSVVRNENNRAPEEAEHPHMLAALLLPSLESQDGPEMVPYLSVDACQEVIFEPCYRENPDFSVFRRDDGNNTVQFSWSSLKCLGMSPVGLGAQSGTSTPCILFRNAPLLHELRICNPYFNPRHFILPWNQITTVRFHNNHDTPSVSAFLCQLPNIKHVEFSKCNLPYPQGDAVLPITSLTTIHSDGALGLAKFPRLERLELRNMGEGKKSIILDTSGLRRFMSNLLLVSGGLTELALLSVPIAYKYVLMALAEAVYLKRLVIVESFMIEDRYDCELVTPEFVEGLEDLVPDLEHLKLVWREYESIEEELVVRMLEKRCNTPLTSAVIGPRSGGPLQREVLDRMQALRDRGLMVTLN